MSGSYQSHGQLKVTKRNTHGGTETTLFEKNGDQRAGWKNAVVEITNQGEYEVRIYNMVSTVL